MLQATALRLKDLDAMPPKDAKWNDVGSWSALLEIGDKDAQGNVCFGDVMNHDTTNSYLRSDNKMNATIGLDNVIVVDTKDEVLVVNADRTQDVNKIVERLQTGKRSEHEFHQKVCRPWGKYDSTDAGERYQVNRITDKLGTKLSVQMYHHLAEHWIVVSGTANVQLDEEDIIVTENQYIYIPPGTVHTLENQGKFH